MTMTDPTAEMTIATVLFGGADTLMKTLPTWAEVSRDLPVRFLFVDNSDDSAAHRVVEAQSWQPDAMVYVHSGGTVGFAAAANRAVRDSTTAAVFLLNADVTLRAGQLEQLIALGPPSSPRAVSLVTDGRATAGIDLNPVGWFSDRPVSSRQPCLGPSGGAAVFDREQFLEVGGLTDPLFAWGEDAALALRLWTRGIRTEVADLRLEHSGGHSVASLAGLRRKAFWLARNRVWILRAQYSRPYRASVGVLMLGMLMLNGLRKVRSGTAGAYFRGAARGFVERPPWTTEDVMTLRAHLGYLDIRGRRRASVKERATSGAGRSV